jgi:hypothetical protein
MYCWVFLFSYVEEIYGMQVGNVLEAERQTCSE